MAESKEYHDYSSVDGSDDEALLGENGFQRRQLRSMSLTSRMLSWIIHITLVICLVATGVAIGYNIRGTARKGLEFADMSYFRRYDGVTFEPREQRFNGSLFKRSAYSGPPTPEMDATWGRFTEAGSSMLVEITEESMPDYQPILNISTEDARASSSIPLDTAVHLEATNNVGYMASLGFFHQIHCLNMLRKFIYLDYYKKSEPHWYTQPYLRGHADHCIDMLRESIMCQGDTTLITYHWVKGYVDPVPDFSTVHTCRDPEAILDWMKTNQIILEKAVYKHGEKDLDEIF